MEMLMLLLFQKLKQTKHFQQDRFTLTDIHPTPYRLDQNCNGGGIMIYVREDMPSRLTEINNSIEGIFIELNLRKNRWFFADHIALKKVLFHNIFI